MELSSFQTKSWNITCARPRDSPDPHTPIPVSVQSLNSLILGNNGVGGKTGKPGGPPQLSPPLLTSRLWERGPFISTTTRLCSWGHLP